MVPRVTYQLGADQKWSPECLTSYVEVSSGLRCVFSVRWRSVVVLRVSYQLSGDR